MTERGGKTDPGHVRQVPRLRRSPEKRRRCAEHDRSEDGGVRESHERMRGAGKLAGGDEVEGVSSTGGDREERAPVEGRETGSQDHENAEEAHEDGDPDARLELLAEKPGREERHQEGVAEEERESIRERDSR